MLTVAFARPVEALAIDLIPGNANRDACTGVDRWYQFRRLQQVEYEFSDGSSIRQTFDTDSPTFQRTVVPRVITTTAVRVRVLASVPPGGQQVIGDKNSPNWDAAELRQILAISEVRVYGANAPVASRPKPGVPHAPDFTPTIANLHVDVKAPSSGTAVEYTWNFGDGSTVTGATASHYYAAAGTYTITLTIDDGQGHAVVVAHDVMVA